MQRLALSLCIVAITAGVCRVSAQEGGLPSSLEITDPRSPDADLASGDVLGLEAWDGGAHLGIAVRMAIPLDEGMYTHLEFHIDCDDDPDSGIAGCELRVVAAVGSRFAPNVLPSRGDGTSDPLAIRRASWSQIEIYETVATGSRKPSWFLTGTLAPPTVNGDTLLVLIPRELIRELGDRYHRRLRFRRRSPRPAPSNRCSSATSAPTRGSPSRSMGDPVTGPVKAWLATPATSCIRR